MSKTTKKRSRGLGDTAKKAIQIGSFGLIKQKPGCGCKGRQAWLNKKFPYKWFREAMAKHTEMTAAETEKTRINFQHVTEELLTPEQKAMRDKLIAQKTGRPGQTPSVPAQKGKKTKCAPCEAARLERERVAALKKNQPDTTPES